MDVRERLIALMTTDPFKWWTPPEMADHLIANGVTITPAVPGPREDNHNITELCFLNGKEAGRWEVKTKILEKLMEQRTNVKGVCHAQLVEFIKFVEGL